MDRNGVITDWNPRARITFGWTRDEVLGRDLAETIIPKRFRDHHRRGLERFLSGGGGPVLDRLIELAGLHRDGREFPVELTISAIESETGFSFYAFLRDISERKRAEEKLAGNLLDMGRLQLELESQNEVLAERVRETHPRPRGGPLRRARPPGPRRRVPGRRHAGARPPHRAHLGAARGRARPRRRAAGAPGAGRAAA